MLTVFAIKRPQKPLYKKVVAEGEVKKEDISFKDFGAKIKSLFSKKTSSDEKTEEEQNTENSENKE